MPTSFRAKLLTIVASAAFAFVVLFVTSSIVGARVDVELTKIEQRHLPRVELGPRLDADFVRLGRGFQDAVAARDLEALERTRDTEQSFLAQLAAAHDAVDPADALALRSAMEDYFAAGYDLSRRLLTDETGEAIVGAMTAMQAKRARVKELLELTTSFDRREITDAFAAANRAQATARRVQLYVSAGAIGLVLLLTLWLSRGVLRALSELTAGFVRFGGGEFAVPIAVVTNDELGRVATQANAMAVSLALLEEERDAKNEELRAQGEELQRSNDELLQQTRDLALARRGLERKAQELTTVSAYKSQFLANMSHELRTPLNSMLLLSNLLADNDARNLTPKQVEYAQTIHGAGNDLLLLINQVLDLAKVEAGKQEVRASDVTIRGLGDRCERIYGPLARKKGLRFVVDVAKDLPETIVTDEQRTNQILNNLVGNAIKFTEIGEVKVTIARDGERIAFIVTDTGAGIAPEHQERIFAPFEQVDGATDRRYGGTGLGLTIARDVARLLGGELRLESSLGHGSSFTLFLPEARPSNGAGASSPRAAVPAEDYLLVIEDDRTLGEVLKTIIADHGFASVVAEDGASGLRIARERLPRGIILDVMLPGVDGWSVMEQLRADPALAAVPVHFLSALDEAGRGLAMGAIGYATKPATRRDLVHVVASLTSDEIGLFVKGLHETPSPERASANAPSADVRLDGCRVLLADDDMRTVYALSATLRAKGVDVLVADTGAAAIDALHAHPDVEAVLMDIMMPEMDGYEATRRIRSEARFQSLPIIALTAKAMKGDRERCLEAGATDYLPKPIDADRLLRMLHGLVSTEGERERR